MNAHEEDIKFYNILTYRVVKTLREVDLLEYKRRQNLKMMKVEYLFIMVEAMKKGSYVLHNT